MGRRGRLGGSPEVPQHAWLKMHGGGGGGRSIGPYADSFPLSDHYQGLGGGGVGVKGPVPAAPPCQNDPRRCADHFAVSIVGGIVVEQYFQAALRRRW